MSATTFARRLHRVRDQDLPIERSWFLRFGAEEEPCYFELWSTQPFEKLTPDDLLWCLFAAAADREATHLMLHIFPGHCLDADDTLMDLVEGFHAQYGFWPFDFDLVCWDPDTQQCTALVCSLFSYREGMRGAGIYETDDEYEE